MTKNTSWNQVAVWYDALLQNPDSYQHAVILPNLIRLLDLKKGETMLDLACGQGFFAKEFITHGAQVIGVDISPHLIAKAKQHAPKAKLYVAPADAIPFIANRSLDTITCLLAIQNIKNVDGVFLECARVLKNGGRLIVVMNHPAFRIPKQSSWGWDSENKTQYRRVDSYLSEMSTEITMHPGKNKTETTVSFHRPLQYYFKLLHKHGLAVTKLEEWISPKNTPAGPRAAAENKARKEFPLFLFLEAKKS